MAHPNKKEGSLNGIYIVIAVLLFAVGGLVLSDITGRVEVAAHIGAWLILMIIPVIQAQRAPKALYMGGYVILFWLLVSLLTPISLAICLFSQP